MPKSEGHEWTPSFYETFSTAVGQTIDENLSISRTINSGRYVDRSNLIQDMESAGEIEAGVLIRHRDINGQVNWNAIAEEVADDRIKTDEQIELEIADELAWRRENSKQYLEKGSGVAQFLGEANSYMLDPINIASMFVATPVIAGAKGFQGVFQAAARGGVISAGSETLIQPFVFQFKSDIDSPYSVKDSLGAIATAAIGGAAIDSGIHGIGSLIRKLRGDVDKIKTAGYKEQDLDAADVSLTRIDELLQGSDVEIAKIFRPEKTDEYWQSSRGKSESQDIAESIRMSAESKIIRSKLGVEEPTGFKFDYDAEIESLVNARIAEAEASLMPGLKLSDKQLEDIALRLEQAVKESDVNEAAVLTDKIETHNKALEAEANVVKVKDDLSSGELKKSVSKDIDKQIISKERDHIQTYMNAYNGAIKPAKPRMRVQSGEDLRGASKSMQSAKEQGIDYADELAQYEALDSDIPIEFEGNQLSSKELIEKFDDDIETLNQIEACYLG